MEVKPKSEWRKSLFLVALEDYLLKGANSDPSFAMRVIVRDPIIERTERNETKYVPEIEAVMSMRWLAEDIVTFTTHDGNVTIKADEVVGYYS